MININKIIKSFKENNIIIENINIYDFNITLYIQFYNKNIYYRIEYISDNYNKHDIRFNNKFIYNGYLFKRK